MGLIASKRFEFAASHYYRHPGWTTAQNETVFGKDAYGPHGHGHNFVMYAGFTGPLDPENGMIIELSHVKRDVLEHVLPRYDHYVLNTVPAFAHVLPTPENMASTLLSEIGTVFAGRTYRPAHVHLIESSVSAATAYADGRVERHWQQALGNPRFFDFWGTGAVTLGITLAGIPDRDAGAILPDKAVLARLRQLASQVSQMTVDTSEAVLPQILVSLADFPCARVVLRTPHGTFEHDGELLSYSVTGAYTATHRLINPERTLAENEACFGKCHRHHGHTFDVEVTVSDSPLSEVQTCLAAVLAQWDYQALDSHSDFDNTPCTTEHMVRVLAEKWAKLGVGSLRRIRLHETPNNRFSLRL